MTPDENTSAIPETESEATTASEPAPSSANSDRLQLPHTSNCLVCGRKNAHGMKLDLFVDKSNGVVTVEFVTQPHHVGFEGIVHGGLLATVIDEAMTWAASWNVKRMCVCGEISVRFRINTTVGERVRIEARTDFSRPKLIEPSCKMFDADGHLLATAAGKYVPVTPEQHRQFIRTFTPDPRTHAAAVALGFGSTERDRI